MGAATRDLVIALICTALACGYFYSVNWQTSSAPKKFNLQGLKPSSASTASTPRIVPDTAGAPPEQDRHTKQGSLKPEPASPTDAPTAAPAAAPAPTPPAKRTVADVPSNSEQLSDAEIQSVRLANCGGSFLKEIAPSDVFPENKTLAEAFGSLWIPRSELHPAIIKDGRVDTCAVVSSGGALKGTKAGADIDKHDLVFRMNAGGAVLPFVLPEDAGNRTNILFWNHPDVRRKCFFTGNDDLRRCVPHALFPGAKTPTEPMQFLVAYLNSKLQLPQLLNVRKNLGKDGWRIQVFNEKFKKVLPFGLRSWPNARWGASAGAMAFWIASILCRSIDTYGFAGVVPGKTYHSYAWCDVDRILRVNTSDCKHVHASAATASISAGVKSMVPPDSTPKARRLGGERSEFGFTRNMEGHNFDAEKKAMEKFKSRECLDNCFEKCKFQKP